MRGSVYRIIIKRHLEKIREILSKSKALPQSAIINQLNPIIRGWTNYTLD
jgi:RNA-directed DNA polymerase